jgi:beta-glucanase (GH16 family)
MSKQRSVSLLTVLTLCVLLFACGKKHEDPPAPVVPVIKIDDASQTRTIAGTTMHFNVTLNRSTTVPVSVDFSLADGTATAPRDYVAATGTLTILANQVQGSIDVQIKGDPTDTRQDNLVFTVQLSNAKSGALGVLSAKGTILTEDGTNISTDNTGYSTPLTYPGYTLAWNDEFNATSLDGSVWGQETGNNNGWGNSELEYYTTSAKNTLLSHGNLVLEARKESINGFNYSSSRMTTQGKKTFTFGRIDMRAKLPVGKGIWPALWMLGSNISSVPWPACGEIDMMELIGNFPGRVYGTAHWANAAGAHDSKGTVYNLFSGDFSQQFHVFSVVWSQDVIKWLIDDQLYLTVVKADVGTANYPFNAPEFLIFNIAVGGNFPGAPDPATWTTQRMFVDYVRVFQ